MSTARFSSSEPVDLSDVDWERVKGFTDEDIDRQIAEDPDVAPDCSGMGPGRVVLAPEALDVKAIRKRLGYSLNDFAHHYGIPIETVREWEEGGNVPEGPARVLLQIIVREPEAVERALYASKAR
jgi:putative transcriptional regulator